MIDYLENLRFNLLIIENMNNTFDDKVILVTGGTGSFGKNFVKFLLDNSRAKKIIVFSRDELKQFHMQREMGDDRLRFFLGDIRDLPRLERAFDSVEIVVHAAALKQVQTLEYNPFEAVKTNVIGSQNVIEAAIDNKVEKVVLISTDKASQPSNLYGSTKLCAEKLFISANSYTNAEQTTKFSCVRYGNVIASRGSLIEILLDRKDSAAVQITDERMTRFWITLEQSFQLVTFALEQMEGGEIFIPKLPSMKLVDVFEAIAPNVKREVIGIKAGEKLHEVLLSQEESRHTLELENYYVILREAPYFSAEVYQKYYTHGRKLETGFSLISNTNNRWLTSDELKNIVQSIK